MDARHDLAALHRHALREGDARLSELLEQRLWLHSLRCDVIAAARKGRAYDMLVQRLRLR